jgi:hypothetical protein
MIRRQPDLRGALVYERSILELKQFLRLVPMNPILVVPWSLQSTGGGARMTRLLVIALVAASIQMARAAYGSNQATDRRPPGGDKVRSPGERTVKLGPTRLQYFEGENRLVLYVEPARDKDGFYYIVYVPTPERWVRTMPAWSRHRRDEILIEIKRLTKDERIKWVDQD